jgi:hypothetical protein
VTCASCRDKLPEHVETAILEVSRHLRDCRACRAEHATLQHALALLDSDPCPSAPSLQAGLWARIEAAQAPRAAVWERPVGLAMAALLLGAVARSLLLAWPVLHGWVTGAQAWPSAWGLATVFNSQLGTALDGVQRGAAGTLAVWQTWPQSGPVPYAAWLALLAAAGWLIFEWTARREASRLAPGPEGVR